LKTTLANLDGQTKLSYKMQKNKFMEILKAKAREWWSENIDEKKFFEDEKNCY
jgi:hypothetical protein